MSVPDLDRGSLRCSYKFLANCLSVQKGFALFLLCLVVGNTSRVLATPLPLLKEDQVAIDTANADPNLLVVKSKRVQRNTPWLTVEKVRTPHPEASIESADSIEFQQVAPTGGVVMPQIVEVPATIHPPQLIIGKSSPPALSVPSGQSSAKLSGSGFVPSPDVPAVTSVQEAIAPEQIEPVNTVPLSVSDVARRGSFVAPGSADAELLTTPATTTIANPEYQEAETTASTPVEIPAARSVPAVLIDLQPEVPQAQTIPPASQTSVSVTAAIAARRTLSSEPVRAAASSPVSESAPVIVAPEPIVPAASPEQSEEQAAASSINANRDQFQRLNSVLELATDIRLPSLDAQEVLEASGLPDFQRSPTLDVRTEEAVRRQPIARIPRTIVPPTVAGSIRSATPTPQLTANFAFSPVSSSLPALPPRPLSNLDVVRLPSRFVIRAVGLQFPLAIPAPITSSFGWRVHPVTGDRRFHSGTDLGAPEGTPVVAAAAGRVELAENLGGYGGTVILSHANGLEQTLYAHLSEINVTPGTIVEAGTQIGRVGSTGLSTGPHLHFEARKWSPQGWLPVDAGAQLQYALAQFTRLFSQRS